MKKYACRAGRYMPDAKIEEFECEKETDSSVWIKGRRQAKRSEWRNFYDTWEEARQALLAYAETYCKTIRCQLERANGALGNIKGMKNPSGQIDVA